MALNNRFPYGMGFAREGGGSADGSGRRWFRLREVASQKKYGEAAGTPEGSEKRICKA